jgi:phosphopantothenate synthetase
VQAAQTLKKQGAGKCREILRKFDNKKNLAESITLMNKNLSRLAGKSARTTGEGE